MDEAGTVFTVEEAAGLLRIHPETVRREIKAGRMPACRIGRDYRISRSDLEGYYRAGGGGSLFPDAAPARLRLETAAAGTPIRGERGGREKTSGEISGEPSGREPAAPASPEAAASSRGDGEEPSRQALPLLTHADMAGIDCRAVDPRCFGIRLDEPERRSASRTSEASSRAGAGERDALAENTRGLDASEKR